MELQHLYIFVSAMGLGTSSLWIPDGSDHGVTQAVTTVFGWWVDLQDMEVTIETCPLFS